MIEFLNSSFFGTMFGAIVGGVSVYSGIRASIAALTARITNAELAAAKAHERIDRVLQP